VSYFDPAGAQSAPVAPVSPTDGPDTTVYPPPAAPDPGYRTDAVPPAPPASTDPPQYRTPTPAAAPVSPDRAPEAVTRLLEQVSSVLLGDPTPIKLAISAFLAGGHVLLEDIPGVGKTLVAKALSVSIGGTFGRMQGTADLLPSDLTGVSIYEEDTRRWHVRQGPLFNNVALVDELNRATPRTQSALLEAMAERQVTIDGESYGLPDPFFVIATQNPHGDLGTFPLVAGQRDRFAVSLSLGLPGRQAERLLVSGSGGEPTLATIGPIADLAYWQTLRNQVGEIYVHPTVTDYALDLIDLVRNRVGRDQPLSTRAALMLLNLSRAHALVEGRPHVTPDDVQAIAPAALAHRLLDATNGDLVTARNWIHDFVKSLPVPPAPR
jgi:MoxR-like ATPase